MIKILDSLRAGIREKTRTDNFLKVYIIADGYKYIVSLVVALLIAYFNNLDAYNTTAMIFFTLALVIFVQKFFYIHIYLDSWYFMSEVYATLFFLVSFGLRTWIDTVIQIDFQSIKNLMIAFVMLGTAFSYSIFVDFHNDTI